MSTLKGIDISTWQGDISWNKVKDIDFVIIRAGFGKNTLDNRAIKNIEGCKKNNIPFGLYWFSYALSVEDSKQEANYLCDLADKYKITFPVLGYDWEYDSDNKAQQKGVNITNDKRYQFGKAFLEIIKKRGYNPLLYVNYDYLNKGFKELANTYDVWFANPGGKKPDIKNLAFWQYSWEGKISGINADVDMNYCYKNYTTNNNQKKESSLNNKIEPPIIYTQGVSNNKKLGIIKGGTDYSGIMGKPLVALAAKVSKGTITYEIHTKKSGWAGSVSKFDFKDFDNGYAGDGNPPEKGNPIDGVKMYYKTPSDVIKQYGYYKVAYRVHLMNGKWLDWQYDTEKTNGQDGYAGVLGKTIDAIETKLVKA